MRLFANVLLVMVLLSLVLSCSLFSGIEEESTTSKESRESSEVAEGGGTEVDSEEEETVETPEVKPEPLRKTTTVRFLKGKSSRTYKGTIQKGGSLTYLLAASKGQDMDVEISTKKNNAKLRVVGPSGKAVSNEGSPAIFSANLPATGTYKIIVTSDDGDDSVTLDFIVAGGAKATPEPPGPGGLTTTVKFRKGRSSATYKNAVIRGERNTYVLGAAAGQQMSVSISSLEDNAVFQIRGPNGYLPGAGPGTDRKSWSGQLPANGKYRVIVGGTRGNATYTVTFSIR